MLIYDIIHKLLDSLTERDLDLLVLILKSKLLKLMHAYMHVCTYYFSSLSSLSLSTACGMEIRRNDSLALKVQCLL